MNCTCTIILGEAAGDSGCIHHVFEFNKKFSRGGGADRDQKRKGFNLSN